MFDYPAGIRSRTIKDINGLSMHILEAGYEDKANKLISFILISCL